MTNASMPPAKEKRGERYPSAGANAVTSTATNCEPAVMPMMPGSASGLFMTAWVMTPATAIAMPPRMATKMRGKRSCTMMATSSSYSTNSPRSICTKLTLIPPMFAASSMNTTSSAAVTTKASVTLSAAGNFFFVIDQTASASSANTTSVR